MVETKIVDILFATFDEGYFLYKGFYRGLLEVRIQGTIRDYGYRKDTNLRAYVYWNGYVMNSYIVPVHTMATARKRAKALLDETLRFTQTARQRGFEERADYNSHMPIYRNHHADNDLPYYDYRRANGPIVMPNVFLPRAA